MASEIRVNTINNRSGLGTISITNSGAVFSGVTTFAQIQTTSGEVTVGTGASVFSPATNVLALGTNNTEKVRIDSSGNFGIGTNNPTAHLHLNSSGATQILVNTTSSSSEPQIILQDTAASDYFAIQKDGRDLRFKPQGSEALRITSSGNIGIGTQSPETSRGNKGLEVAGTTGAEFVATRFDDNLVDGDFIGGFIFKNLDLGGTPNHFAGMYAKANGTAGSMDLHFSSGRDGYENDNTDLIVRNNRIGIGTDNPQVPLHVFGNTRVRVGTDQVFSVTSTGGVTQLQGINEAADTFQPLDIAGSIITLSPNSSEALRITSSGNVGIGTDIIEGKLTIFATAAEPPTSGTTANSAIQLYSSLSNQMNFGLNTVNGSYGAYIQVNDNNHAVNYPLNLQPNGGNVGIQTNNPYGKLHIGSAAVEDAVNDVDTTNTSLVIKQSTNTRDDGIYIERSGERKGYYMWINPGGGAGDGLTFTRNNNGTKTNALILDREANAHFGGNAVFANGNGIDFSATSNATGSTSELLDDYEEGTWQPTVTTGTVGYAFARYTKIGRQVTVAARINSFSDRSSSAPVVVGNLPFNSDGSNPQAGGSAFFRYVNTQFTTVFVDGDDLLFYRGSTGAFDSMQHQDITDSTCEIYFFATYFTA